MQIQRRQDIDPEQGIRKYGDVPFADPVNNKFPIDTPDHVRGAWGYINATRNARFYSSRELEFIRSRIIDAAKRFGIELSPEVVERDAKLFAAGSYPDRGIEVTEEDLDRMVEGHQPVPIKVEHVDTPLRLGTVTKLWRAGKDLFGRLAFTAPAWALVQASGATSLSAAVKRDKSGLVEVSLVRQPRVAGAAVFGSAECGLGNAECPNRCSGRAPSRPSAPQEPDEPITITFEISEGGDEMSDSKAAEFAERISDLERQLKAREVDREIDTLKRAGKLMPAAEDLARAILLSGDAQVVTFADGTEKPVAETFLAFMEAQPKVVEFSELAQGAKDTEELSEAERELYAKLGISEEAVRRHSSS